ncbi:tyrosine-protein kinase receptor UFO-like [Dysidea avara]|uniref:tyrosine-protein kinase receptor UFO-like n=1 Tax=Dysidea avara TaxID=196820 RepID=UPI00332662A0
MNFKTPYFQQTNICYDSIPMTMAPAPMTSNNSSEIMLLIGLLVGAVVLVIVLTLIVVGVCVVWRRRVMNKRLVLVLNRLEQNPGYTDSTFITEYQQFNHKIQLFTNTTSYRDRVASFLGGNPDPLFAEFEEQLAGHAIKANMLQINEQIAEGAFGKVYKGVYTRNGEEVDVAIKTLRDVTFNKAKEFIRECITAIQFSHPNVLGIIGVSVLREEGIPLMVLPYMCHGDVKSFLKSKRKIQMEPTEYPEGLSYDVLIKICSDVSKGMEYLSSLHFVHRDLAARNCMLDSSMVTKVADFGFSRDVHSTDYYRLGHPAPLPIKWLAPEALNERLFTTKSDVWSFGITCWEVFTLGSQPYPSVDHNEMASYLHNGGSLDKPHLSTDEMYGIMRHCWNYKAEDRPTFSLLVEEIDHLLYDDSDDQLITEHKTSFTNTAM